MERKNMGYSMPLTAPIYNEPPYYYRGGSILLCVYRTKEDILKQIIPQPLKPAEGNLVYAWINDFGTCFGLGPYREAIISVPAEFQGALGNYMVYLYLDRDTPIAAGREIWGFPKKMGRFSFSKEEEVESRAVERGGRGDSQGLNAVNKTWNSRGSRWARNTYLQPKSCSFCNKGGSTRRKPTNGQYT